MALPAAHQEAVEDVFESMSRWFREESRRHPEGTAPVFFYEAGKLAMDRKYFFLKQPWSEGFLVCRNEGGWQVFRAHKIVETETFIRGAELFDAATVLLRPGQPARRARIQSVALLGGDHAAVELYRQRLFQCISSTH